MLLFERQAFDETIPLPRSSTAGNNSESPDNRDYGFDVDNKFYLKYKRAGVHHANDIMGYDKSTRVKKMKLDIEVEDQTYQQT